ncbi:uncharacterized protein [Prorops nasuta]|uniref:uncharacterized protein n=1 Tax=Prorops nasuta TaxID=863751 RepID=UPI0034CD92E1
MSEIKSSSSDKPAYKILQNDQVGRYMVAGRALEAGEEIITEMPFVIGPKAFTYSLCLSCYTPWPPTADDKPLCSKCGWPVCDSECENQPQHRDYECQVFAEVGEKFNVEQALSESNENGIPQLECITPLRLLLESEKSPDRWNEEVKTMETHNQKRCKGDQWKLDNVNIVEYLRNRLKLDRFSEEQIQTLCGILQINTFEVRTLKGFSARALYPTVALMNHSCVSNTCHSVSPTDYRIRLRTATTVPEGGELYGSYTHSLLPTMLRREHLLEGKYFACACTRCSDPTELGTHMSTLKCNKCDNGVVLPLDSLDPESTWKCTICEFSTSGQAVKKVFQIIQAEVEKVDILASADEADGIEERENIIKKYHSVLHPRHAFLTMLRHSLSQLYGRVNEYLIEDLPDVVLEHKVDICRLLLQVLDVVEPGYSRIRGMTLYELHAPLLFLARGQWTSGTIDDAGLKSKMTEASVLLKEAAIILSLEPPDTPEGQIGIIAKESLIQLEQSMNDLQTSYLFTIKIIPLEIIVIHPICMHYQHSFVIKIMQIFDFSYLFVVSQLKPSEPFIANILNAYTLEMVYYPVSNSPAYPDYIQTNNLIHHSLNMPVEESSKAIVSNLKYTVQHSEKLGRYLVAARNIAPGEVIVREATAVVGPTAFNKEVVCFACLSLLPKFRPDARYICSKCNVAPLCGKSCEEKQKSFHTKEECDIFRTNESLSSSNSTTLLGILLPLRLWLLKNKKSEIWEKIKCMQSHVESRKGTAVWMDREINVVKVIEDLGLLPEEENKSVVLQELCGILDVNTFELRSPGGLDGLFLRGLYTEAALMAHNCRANTHLTVDDSFEMTIYASLPIEQGEAILFNYTSSLLGTAERKEHLREGKYFECDCEMCNDPFEMNSHLSTILCPRCKGLVAMEDPMSIRPYDKNAKWQCRQCQRTYSGWLIRTTLEITRNFINDVPNDDPKILEALLNKLSRTLHSNHFLMLTVKQKLLTIYRNEVSLSVNPQRKIIQKMLDLCKEVYAVLEIVEPGISRLKGILLYEIHLPLIIMANRAYSANEISISELASRLVEGSQILKKALTMLLLEPATTPEGKLAKRALQELKLLNQNIMDVKSLEANECKSLQRKKK